MAHIEWIRNLMPSDLELENAVVLDTVQAAIGLIPAAIVAVSVEVRQAQVVLHFAVAEGMPIPEEDIGDIVSELDVLVSPEIQSLDSRVHRAPSDRPAPLLPGRPVYRAKPSTDDTDSR